jgi:DNA-binding PadR family transcriptional regulator
MNRHFRGRCGSEGRWQKGMIMMGSRSFGFGPGNFHFEWDGREGGGRRGGGRGRRRMFGSGELRLVLLKLIADEPRHGYDLIRAIEEMTHGDYAPSPGVIYPTLTMLQDMGLIEEQASEGARKKFAVTEDGRKHLEENSEEIEALMERLEESGETRRRGSSPHLGRAVGNLMQALRNRVAHEGWDETLVHEITEILDEAARRIERLG